MKSFLIISLAIAGIIYCAEAAVSHSMPSTHPDHPDKCWDDLNKVPYDQGSNYPKGICAEIHCSPKFEITNYTCGYVSPPPGFHNEVDLSKPYPDCCVNLVEDKKSN